MMYIALKLFATCVIVFIACAIINDAIKPRNGALMMLNIIGASAAVLGFITLFGSLVAFIWS